jgi:hypothetical protein
MSVAHAEAVVAAAAFQPAPSDIDVAAVLLGAIRHGPSALASSPPVQQALQSLAERLGVAAEVSLQCWHIWQAVHSDDVLRAACTPCLQGSEAAAVAALLHREPQPGDGLELAQAAATRSCAYLRCANLAGEGGPAAGQGTSSLRCSKCKVAWYCGTACSHGDWRAGHRRMCGALGAARLAEQESTGR